MKRLKKAKNGRLEIKITGRHLARLEHAAHFNKSASIREKATAIFKLAMGWSVTKIAEKGLLFPRHRSIIYIWLKDYMKGGLAAWEQPRQRREKITPEQVDELIETVLGKSPEDFDSDQSRWTLRLIQAKLPFMHVYKSLSGIWYLIQRHLLRWLRSRDQTTTADEKWPVKIRRNRRILGYVRKFRHKAVMLFLDEFSVYRQPLSGNAWAGKGTQPRCKRSRRANSKVRVIGAVNAVDGKLHYDKGSKITVAKICDFLETLRQAYPNKKIYLVLDNWHNVHNNPKTIAKLDELGIVALWQPTYMPQSNPIERLWWHLSEQLLRVHRLSDKFNKLKEKV